MTTPGATAGEYWSREAAQLAAELGSSPRGLSAAEAATRLEACGPNSVEARSDETLLRQLLRQFASPLVLILAFGAVVSLLAGEWVDASIILAIVVGSTLLGFVQEYRASNAVAELRSRLALSVQALRDGAPRSVAVREIVPGDVVLLSAGNLVPADGRVLEAKDFLVSEASLTGESFPVEKLAGVLPAATGLGARTNSVFLGTSVRSGEAAVLVVETGRATAYGAIAARLGDTAPETEFARGIREFGYLLLRVMLMMVFFVLAVNLLQGRPGIESLLFAVALAVGMSPELLPAIVTVTLSHGARAMAKAGVIVRRLEAIENLGSIDVLCTDTTGTLTEGVIALDAAVDAGGAASDAVLRLAHVNAALETGIDNPLDAAIVTAGKARGLDTAGWRKVDEIPYDFIRKRLTIVAAREDDGEQHVVITKGAFASVLAACSHLRQDGREVPLDDVRRGRLEDYFRARGEQGSRALALATRRVPPKPHYGHDDESAMVFEGFLLFLDPPKPEATKTIADLAALGIRIKVITGDNRYVSAHVAAAIGLDGRAMLTGEQVAGMRDEALWHLAERTDLFVEVDPQQKERIVRALQRAGHAVGFMGDGITDAPALLAADVGISGDQAVDVARESADVVLLQRDLAVLKSGVEYGRRTFANTLKYISITNSANFGNMVSMAQAAPLLPFLPLAAKQILLNNFLSDVPSIAISTDNVDAESVAQAQRWDVAEVRRFMIVFGLVSTAFDLLTFALLLLVFKADEATFQTTWFAVSLLTELAVVMALRTRLPMLKSAPSRTLLVLTIAVAAITLWLPYAGSFAAAFGFVPLPAHLFATVIVIVIGYILITEAAKARYYRRPPRP